MHRPSAPVMAQSLGEVILVVGAAVPAGIQGIAAFRAGRGNHRDDIVVLRHGDRQGFGGSRLVPALFHRGDGEGGLGVGFGGKGQRGQSRTGGNGILGGIGEGHYAVAVGEAGVIHQAGLTGEGHLGCVIGHGVHAVGGVVVGNNGQRHSLALTLGTGFHTLQLQGQTVHIGLTDVANLNGLERTGRYVGFGNVHLVLLGVVGRADRIHGHRSAGGSRLQLLGGNRFRIQLHGIGGDQRLVAAFRRSIGSGGDQSGRPYAVAHIAQEGSLIGFGLLVEDQLVNLVGIACEVGQIKVPVLAHNQGAVHRFHVVVAFKGESQLRQVRGIRRQPGAHALVCLIDPEVPNGTALIHEEHMLGIQHLLIVLIPVLLIAQRRDGRQVIHTAGQIKGHGVQIHGILGREEVIVVDAADQGRPGSGEVGAVLHIPQRYAGRVARRLDALAGGRIHLVHGPSVGRGVVDIEHVVQGILGDGHNAGIQGRAAGPGAVVLQVPGEEHGVAVGILYGALQRDLHSLHNNGAGGGNGGIQVGSCRNDGFALLHRLDVAVGIHGRNAGIRRGPGDGTVCGGPGLHIGRQLGRAAAENPQGAGRQLHAGNFRGGLRPAAAGGLFGND